MRRVLQLLRSVQSLEFVDVPSVVGRHDPRALRGVMRAAATDGDETITFALGERLVGVHHVVVLRVRLDLVVDRNRDARVLEVRLALVDNARAPQPRGHEQDVLQTHRRRLGSGVLVRPRPEQRPWLLEELLYRKLEHLGSIHTINPLLSLAFP